MNLSLKLTIVDLGDGERQTYVEVARELTSHFNDFRFGNVVLRRTVSKLRIISCNLFRIHPILSALRTHLIPFVCLKNSAFGILHLK